jgi:hypothetical protein
VGDALFDPLGFLSPLLGTTGEEGRFRTFFFFATGLSAGITAVLPLIRLERIGRRFFILMSFTAIAFSALAFAACGLETNYLHVALAGLLIAYNVIVPAQAGIDRIARREGLEGRPRRGPATFASVFLVAAAICGASGVVLDALRFSVLSGLGGFGLAASFLSSSLLVGGAATAMVLGHWYLVVKDLSFAPLSRVTLVLMAALVLRVAAIALAACAQGGRWEALVANGDWTGFFLGHGVFLMARGIFGIIAPAFLLWMTWKCVQIRSNQSATGILYVTLAFIVIGEIIAKYFLVSEGLVI